MKNKSFYDMMFAHLRLHYRYELDSVLFEKNFWEKFYEFCYVIKQRWIDYKLNLEFEVPNKWKKIDTPMWQEIYSHWHIFKD